MGMSWKVAVSYQVRSYARHLSIISYALRSENALLSGDHVMGWSTSVARHPTATWPIISSLRRLLARDDAV
jgi:hypothetical protein